MTKFLGTTSSTKTIHHKHMASPFLVSTIKYNDTQSLFIYLKTYTYYCLRMLHHVDISVNTPTKLLITGQAHEPSKPVNGQWRFAQGVCSGLVGIETTEPTLTSIASPFSIEGIHCIHWVVPLPATLTTRNITFLVGDPYKPSFATVTGRGDNPMYTLVFGRLPRWDVDSNLQIFQIPNLERSVTQAVILISYLPHYVAMVKDLWMDYPYQIYISCVFSTNSLPHIKLGCFTGVSSLNHRLSVLWCMASKSIVPWDMTYRKHLSSHCFVRRDVWGLHITTLIPSFGVARK